MATENPVAPVVPTDFSARDLNLYVDQLTVRVQTIEDGGNAPAVEGGYTTPNQVLEALLTVDGASSGIDADLLDGLQATHFAVASDLSAHEAETTGAHGIPDPSSILTTSAIGTSVQGYSSILENTTASFTSTLATKLSGIEAGATADMTATEIRDAYESLRTTVSQSDAEAGTSTTIYTWTPQRVAQAIAALAPTGSAGTVQQGSVGLVLKDGSTFRGYCSTHGQISASSNGGTVIQAMIDHCSNFVGNTGHRGGLLQLAVDDVPITSPIQTRAVNPGGTTTSTTVWPLYIKGQGVLPRPSATTGEIGGTVIRWNSASAPSGSFQAVLDASNDCHGYMFEDFTIDGDTVAACCAVSAGRKAVWTRVQFRYPKVAGFPGSGLTPTVSTSVGIGLYITNGTDGTSDRYVQQRAINCDFIGSNGGIGLVIKDSRGGSGCTDGRIEDVQCNGCNSGGVYIGVGGWALRGGHLTMNNSGSASKNWGLWLDAGFLHVMNLYVDIVPAGPNIYVTNNNFTIVGCFLIANNKATNNTHAAIQLNGSKGSVVGNIWGGLDNTFDYFVERSNTQSAIVGNTGPSGSIGTAIISNGPTTNATANVAY